MGEARWILATAQANARCPDHVLANARELAATSEAQYAAVVRAERRQRWLCQEPEHEPAGAAAAEGA